MINFNSDDNNNEIHIDLSNLDQFSNSSSIEEYNEDIEFNRQEIISESDDELIEYYDSNNFFHYYNNNAERESLLQNINTGHISIQISDNDIQILQRDIESNNSYQQEISLITEQNFNTDNLINIPETSISYSEQELNNFQTINNSENNNSQTVDNYINRNESIFNDLNLIPENNTTFNNLYQSLISRIREVRNTISNNISFDIEESNNYTFLDSENPTSLRLDWDYNQDYNRVNSEDYSEDRDLTTESLDIENYYHKNIYEILNTNRDNPEKNIYKIGNKFAYRKINFYKFLINHKKEINKKIEDIQCVSCYSDFNDKKIILKKINNIDKLEKQTLFAGPCGEHFICYECLKTIALSFENHLINRNNSLIYCIAQNCLTSSGIPVYFDHYQISKVLSLKEYTNYKEYAEIYEFPGFEIVRCPNIINDFRNVYKCNTKNIIPVEKIKETPPGCLIIYCIQNRKCHNSFCYNCKQKIYSYHTKCDICFDNNEYNNPFGINRFLVKKEVSEEELEISEELRETSNQENKIIKRKILEETDYLYRNNEITVDMALKYIKDIIDKSDETANRFQIQCPYCLNFFFKTEKCSALKHCGIERCYSCGKIQEKNQRDLSDHWSASGINGCPRFDNEPYWNKDAECNFLCQDEICYSHEIGECQIEEHQPGIKNMIIERKKAFIYHFLKSLLKETRNKVLEKLDENIYENLSNTFLQKVFLFLESNPAYIKYYSPLVFMKELQEFYK